MWTDTQLGYQYSQDETSTVTLEALEEAMEERPRQEDIDGSDVEADDGRSEV